MVEKPKKKEPTPEELADEGQRSLPIAYFNFAETYWTAAKALRRSKPKATHKESPIRFLCYHAIELYLKAHLRGHGIHPYTMRDKHHLAFEAHTGLSLPKEKQGFSRSRVLSDCMIALNHPHWTNLTLTEIFEGTVRSVTVRISVLNALLTGDNDYDRMDPWSDDAALLLTTVATMDVSAAVVDASNFKARAHSYPHSHAISIAVAPSATMESATVRPRRSRSIMQARPASANPPQDRTDLQCRPLSTACRGNTASIQRASDAAMGRDAARLNFADDRRDIAGEAIGFGLRARYSARPHLRKLRIAENNAARLGCLQCVAGALCDQCPFFLRECCIQVEHERIGVTTDDRQKALRDQRGSTDSCSAEFAGLACAVPPPRPHASPGTTIIAAETAGRSCHAVEIDPGYVDVAIERWQAFTGDMARLEGDGKTFAAVTAERREPPQRPTVRQRKASRQS
jgi:hypothetical protein